MDAFAAPSFVNIALLDSHSMLSLVKPRLLSTASTSKSKKSELKIKFSSFDEIADIEPVTDEAPLGFFGGVTC